MPQASRYKVADIARAAGEAGDRGQAYFQWPMTGQIFNLREKGYCARFVRMCHEAAMDLLPFGWEFASPNARHLEAVIETATISPFARQVEVSLPMGEADHGDVICFNEGTGRHGHVGIYLGAGEFAENTSSSRGPGTTISRLTAGLKARITGVYRVLPAYLVVPLPGGKALKAWCEVENGHSRVELRSLAEGLGYKLIPDHMSKQYKIYLRKRKGGDTSD